MVCGRPLPCPYHTAIIDPNAKPVATVTIPVTADAALRERDRLASIGVWLSPRRKKRKR